MHGSLNTAVLLPTPLQFLSDYLQILTVKVDSGNQVDELEKALVHEKSDSEDHVACVE